MWGDFGGIKPQAALEFECFRTQALGGANSVGDQLPPRGTLDAGAMRLIGNVYALCREAEGFYAGSEALPQVGIVTPHRPDLDEHTSGKSEEGAVGMCEETHYDSAIFDDAGDFSGLDAVLLPDSVTVTAPLLAKLERFYANGGKLLLSHRSGFDTGGNWALPFLPLAFKDHFAEEEPKFPTYWRARPEFDADMSISDRVFYAQGLRVSGGEGTAVLVDRVLPYFKRTDVHYSSHAQTPPVADADRFPAVVAGERFVYFADPIFREYRQTGNIAARDAWKRAMARLVGGPTFGAGLPTTVLSVPRRRGGDLLLTLLHYVPVRKSLDIDMIEERMSFAGLTLRLPERAATVRVFGTGEQLPRTGNGEFTLPVASGRLLLEVPDFFA